MPDVRPNRPLTLHVTESSARRPSSHLRMRAATLLSTAAAIAALGGAPAVAGAATTLTITGAGFGHGVGMSQYGALGFARAGADYRTILAHYYTGTTLGALQASPTVRVLLADGRSSVTFAGAASVGGQPLDPTKTYTAVAGGKGVFVKLGTKSLLTGPAPLAVQPAAGGTLVVGGAGRYRGALELRPSSGGLMAVNAVGLEDYVRGVVARESPSSWPIEALRAQAVAARTYAITTGHPGAAFDQYQDTRSQVYGGVAAETAPTELAVSSTAGQVVTYGGVPVVTYFFSTSGGRTENVENSFLGSSPKPWLKSVDDPYDTASPRHRWAPRVLTDRKPPARLGSLLKGGFRRIDVPRRGVSPRVVSASVVGTRGATVVSGPTLRRVFGLDDTWATFTSVTTVVAQAPQPAAAGVAPTPGSPATGGTVPDGARATAVRARSAPALVGSVRPARSGAWIRVERLAGGRWSTAVQTRLGAAGSFRIAAPARGTYRVRYGSAAVGPSVRVR